MRLQKEKMIELIKKALPTILTTFLLLISNGYIHTLIPLQLYQISGNDDQMVGLASSCYYLGLLLGSFNIAPVIVRVGHIRAYVSFCAILIFAILAHGLTVNVWIWLALRVITGFCVSANYVVFESWMIDIAEPERRGKLLGIYMLALYGGSALGQRIIAYTPDSFVLPYICAAMIVSISILPLTMSTITAPAIESHSSPSFKALFKLSRSGSAACFISGLILAPVYGLMPVYFEKLGLDKNSISWIMFAVIFGGTSMQFPFGKISDSMDRRKVIVSISILMLINIIFMVFLEKNLSNSVILLFIYGGLTFALYPIGISLACDHVKSANIPFVTQGMLLMYGLGSVIGPYFASILMRNHNENFLYYNFVITLLFLVFVIYRIKAKDQKPEDHLHDFVVQVTTTPLSGNLDPRIDDDNNQEHISKHDKS